MSDKPILLITNGDDDPDFFHACRFSAEQGAYIRFAPGDDVLIENVLELERARAQSVARRVVDMAELGWKPSVDPWEEWSRVIARALEERGVTAVRVSPRLKVGYLGALQEVGITLEVDRALFQEERRHKSSEESSFVHSAQRAAEAACAEVISLIGAAEIGEGLLWEEGRPLTSEKLKAEAERVLTEIGYAGGEMIVAGPPESALPHHRGEGQLAAGGPIVIDIFPRGRTSHYHGDLTRTVVAGQPTDKVRRMHEAVSQAMDAAMAEIKDGADGRDVHRIACRVLVEAGFGTSTAGFEGGPGVPRMIHSLGHGVGLEVHEPPYLRDAEYPLRTGDVVTVEPGLYDPGLGGVRIEETGLITKDGFRSFSTLPRSLDPRAYM